VRDDVVRFVLNRKGFHGCSPSAASAAVITFITSLGNTSKRLVDEIDNGLKILQNRCGMNIVGNE